MPQLPILRKLTGVVSGMFSAVLLAVPCLFATSAPLIIGFVLTRGVGQSLWAVVGLGVSLVVAGPIAFAFARFGLRCFPVNADGTRQPPIICGLGFLLILTMSVITLSAFLVTRKGLVSFEGFAIAVFVPFAVTILVASVYSLRVHLYPRFYLSRSFVLFLRRFSTFADRRTVAAVLRGSPPGIRVAFIASPSYNPRNWDAFTWAFAGLRLLTPARSVPIQLRSSDSNWQDYIEIMTQQASAVVMDLSDFSNSLQTELAIVSRETGKNQIVWLRNSEDDTAIDWNSLPVAEPTNIVYYRTGYRTALSGLIGKFALVAVSMLAVMNVLGVDKEFANGSDWRTVIPQLAIAAVILMVLYALFFANPAIAKSSIEQIQTSLGAAVKTAAK